MEQGESRAVGQREKTNAPMPATCYKMFSKSRYFSEHFVKLLTLNGDHWSFPNNASPLDRVEPPQAHSAYLNDTYFLGKGQGVPLHRDPEVVSSTEHSSELGALGEEQTHRASFSVVLHKLWALLFCYFGPVHLLPGVCT